VFFAECDSFYMATVSKRGLPYVQHRYGQPASSAFLDDRTLAIPDSRRNRQYIGACNLARLDQFENVSQLLMSPLFKPAVSHFWRWAEEPWVKLSGTA
jgi:hypothetical protein